MIIYDDYLLSRSFSYLTKTWLGKNEAQTMTYTCLSRWIRDRAGPVCITDPCNLLNAILTPKPHTRQSENFSITLLNSLAVFRNKVTSDM